MKLTITSIFGNQFRYTLESAGLRINNMGDIGEPIEFTETNQ